MTLELCKTSHICNRQTCFRQYLVEKKISHELIVSCLILSYYVKCMSWDTIANQATLNDVILSVIVHRPAPYFNVHTSVKTHSCHKLRVQNICTCIQCFFLQFFFFTVNSVSHFTWMCTYYSGRNYCTLTVF